MRRTYVWLLGLVACSGSRTVVEGNPDAVALDTDVGDQAPGDSLVDTDDGADTDPPPVHEPAWQGAGLPADPLDFTLPPGLDRQDQPLHDGIASTLSTAQAKLDAVLVDVADARGRADPAGCGALGVAWRDDAWYPSIAAAIAAPGASRVVLICPGDHVDDLEVTGPRILASFVPGASTVLRPVFTGPTVDVASEAFLGIVGLQFASTGGGARFIWATLGTELVVASSRFVGASSAALVSAGSEWVVVAGCTFEGNTAYRGAGVDIAPNNAVIHGNTFVSNASNMEGGGLRVVQRDTAPSTGVVVVARNRFEENGCGGGGAGMHAGDADSSLSLATLGNVFVGNRTLGAGGGIQVAGTRVVWQSLGDVVEGNLAEAGSAVSLVSTEPAAVALTDAHVTRNDGLEALAFRNEGSERPSALLVRGGLLEDNGTTRPVFFHEGDWNVFGEAVDFGTGVAANAGGDVLDCGWLGAGASWRTVVPKACEVLP